MAASSSLDLVLVAGFIYAGLFYAAGPRRLAQKETRARDLSYHSVVRNFLLGIFALAVVDAAIFHSGLYQKILQNDSYAGRVASIVATEKNRPPDAQRDVAVIGDSRIVEAFSAQVANRAVASQDLRFANLAVPSASPRFWFFYLRALDPEANRYRAIVIPIRYAETDAWQNFQELTVDVTLSAPVLRVRDAVTFASSFHTWKNRTYACVCCLLRGYAFREDVRELVRNPARRLRTRASDQTVVTAIENYGGHEDNLTGIAADPVTGKVTTPERLTWLQPALETSIQAAKQHGGFARYRKQWLEAILQRYAHSPTRIIFLQVPHGPLGQPPRSEASERTIQQFVRDQKTCALPPHLFDDLERPELFYDADHLNRAGRLLFSTRLANELQHCITPAVTR